MTWHDITSRQIISEQIKKKSKNFQPPSVFPSSPARSVAALTALSTMAANPDASKLWSAASVVPLGLVTFRRSCAGASADSASIRPAPRHVCFASRVACSGESPSAVALAVRCSTSAKKYAGPEPAFVKGKKNSLVPSSKVLRRRGRQVTC